jgi:uncharacterized Tic20 family protein
VQTEEQNYRVVREQGANRAPMMSRQEGKSWSVLAHLSIFLNLFTGFLGPTAALVIWVVTLERHWFLTRRGYFLPCLPSL